MPKPSKLLVEENITKLRLESMVESQLNFLKQLLRIGDGARLKNKSS